ncbi:MAG: amidoligase family protein [Campylobacterota bacterium]
MDNFIKPKIQENYDGAIRKVGFELEFSNIDMQKILNILSEVQKFEIKKINNFLYELESQDGTYILELDFELLTKQKLKKEAKKLFDKTSIIIEDKDIESIQDFIGNFSKDIVPYEISTPPLPLTKIYKVDELVSNLSKNNAYGTKDRIYNAFGLHINIELVSLNIESILSYLKAYVILQDFLNHDAKVDIIRKITPFIDDFKSDYIKYILKKGYKPSQDEFIEDYIRFNPTRNRSLDMLPILAFLDEEKVRTYLPKEKIKKRPAFHYRLSNSLISDKNWNVSQEFNRWIYVEKLANDKESLEELSDKYYNHLDTIINLNTWNMEITKWVEKNLS